MDFDAMPSELVDLEDRLRGRSIPQPPAELRGRVLQATAEAIGRERAAANRSFDGWLGSGIAAAALIAMSLSMFWASPINYSPRSASSSNQMGAELEVMHLYESPQEGTSK